MRSFLCITLLSMLASCGAREPAVPLTPEQSAALRPADAKLASLYETSCKSCHTVSGAQAPLTGNRAQWDPRWERGEQALLAAAIQGKGGMPAGGQCFSCSVDDLTALIRFMAGRNQ
jgi:cytochrome c5